MSAASANSSTLDEIEKKIRDLENKISETQVKEKTLSSQIEVFDNQISLTTLRINATKQQITDLTLDIDTASKKIENIDKSLDNLTKVLVNRIQATYKIGSAPSFQVLLASNNVSDFVERANYLRIVQAHDRRLIYDTVQAKNDYENQKMIFEDKKRKVESLKLEMEKYTAQLNREKLEKDELLRVTQNDEERFQQEAARLRADRDAILAAISNVGSKIGPVDKGVQIANQGNTGCVSPPPPGGHHLHFEVYKDAKVQDNAVVDVNSGEYIQFKYSDHLVNPRSLLDNGQWTKPISIYPSGVTTEFGATSVFGTPHTGIDIAGPVYSPIYASEKGISYSAGGSVCDSAMKYPSGTTTAAKGRIIDHENGYVTLYWHTSN